MSDPLRGIICHSSNDTLEHLPLEEVHVNVLVVDVSARVVLRQVFINASETATRRAKYVFPVPFRASVCGFELQFADGRCITGVVKSKERAAEEYEDATRAGRTAGLVSWVMDDAFCVSVGSIPARQTVTAKVVFVMDLMDDEHPDEVRLQLPMSIGSRYGEQPAALATPASATTHTRLRIAVDVQMSGVVRKISSPSHPEISVTSGVTSRGRSSRRRRTVKFRSRSFLAKSFVLTVNADGLDAPRCFAERNTDGSGTVAMQLTLVPKFKFPIPSQEYLFLVDRSGSMQHDRIDIAKRTLSALLRILPSSGTSLNIFSFGNTVDSLWPANRVYDQNNLDDAVKHVNSMDANYGGTQLLAALQFVFQKRNRLRPTAVFVLTDGEVYEVDPIISAVQNAVALSSPDARLRVFVLGIGSQTSTAVLERMARAGNGECLFAVQNESILGKTSKLLRAGRASFVEEVTIDWGIPDGMSNVTGAHFLDPSDTGGIRLAPPPTVRQSPHQILRMFPGLRFIVFVLTPHRPIPTEVVIQGTFDNGERQVIEVPVSRVAAIFSKKHPGVPLIHTLAARHLIMDLLEGTGRPPDSLTPASVEEIRKAAVIQLGTEYQLASRYTSFIAVDDPNTVRPRARREDNYTSSHHAPGSTQTRGHERPEDATDWSFFGAAKSFAMNLLSNLFSPGRNPDKHPVHTPYRGSHLPGAFIPESSSTDSLSPRYLDLSDEEPDRHSESADTFSTLSSLESHWSEWSAADQDPPPSAEEAAMTRSPSPVFENGPGPSTPLRGSHAHDAASPGDPPPPPLIEVERLLELQNFDGSFQLGPSLESIVGAAALQKPADVRVDDTVWATALAVAYVAKHLRHPGHADLRALIEEKAAEFLGDEARRRTFELLVTRAKNIVL